VIDVATRVHAHGCIYPGCTERVACTGGPVFVDPGFVCEYDLEEGLLCEEHIGLPEVRCQWCGLQTGEVLHFLEDDEYMHLECKAAASPACDGAGLLWLVPMSALIAWALGIF
jgi:hypothetical protein